MSRLEQLRKQAAKLRGKISDLEEKERRDKELPKLRKLVGTHWKYHNSYGNGEKWWLYARVNAVDEENLSLVCSEFQTTTDGRIEIKVRHEHYWGLDPGNWKPCSEEEFREELEKLIETVEGMR